MKTDLSKTKGVSFKQGASIQGERPRIKKNRISNLPNFLIYLDENKIADYISKPVNQKSKLPWHIEATAVNRDSIRPLKKRIKIIDTILAILNVIITIILCRSVRVSNIITLYRMTYSGVIITRVIRALICSDGCQSY